MKFKNLGVAKLTTPKIIARNKGIKNVSNYNIFSYIYKYIENFDIIYRKN